MEQRPLRLGDIVDDYCPRERRITNHVIAALLGDTIKQTRCSTCDVEHTFKGARPPTRKKKEPALETEVLASVNGTQLVVRIDPTQPPARTESAAPSASGPSQVSGASTPAPSNPDAAGVAAAPEGGGQSNGDEPRDDGLPGGWVGHRTLIRAALPRTESDPPPIRQIPEFTMHQRQTRGSHAFRGGQGWSGRGGGGGGPRGNFAHGGGNGNGPERNGNGPERNGNTANFGNSFGNHHGGHGGGHGQPGPGNGQGRPPGQGKRHRHGKNRRPR